MEKSIKLRCNNKITTLYEGLLVIKGDKYHFVDNEGNQNILSYDSTNFVLEKIGAYRLNIILHDDDLKIEVNNELGALSLKPTLLKYTFINGDISLNYSLENTIYELNIRSLNE